MRRHLLVLTLGALAVLLAHAQPRAQVPSTTELLDRYLNGDFESVVATLAGFGSFGDLADDLKEHAQAWIDAAPASERARRELTAATLALEASRLGQDRAWKIIRLVPSTPLSEVTFWQPPATLLEWGCALLRRHGTPTPAERLWQLASIAVATRAGDFEFLIGLHDPDTHKRAEVRYPAPAVAHAMHLQERFPDEARFKLAIGIAEESRDLKRGADIFAQLLDDVDVGGEATMRWGAVALQRGAVDDALAAFARVESKTRDPWVLYHARFLSGRAEARRNRMADAERHYRRALSAQPGTQSATIALATILFRDGRREEAASLNDAMLAAQGVLDPWRGYGDGDDRFWPRLIARVRAEIHP